jgi:hypothetical protein
MWFEARVTLTPKGNYLQSRKRSLALKGATLLEAIFIAHNILLCTATENFLQYHQAHRFQQSINSPPLLVTQAQMQ